jgi:hypothetical protein
MDVALVRVLGRTSEATSSLGINQATLVPATGGTDTVRKHWDLAVAADGRRNALQRKMRGAAALVRTCTAMTRKTHRKINDAMTVIVANARETVKKET